MQNTEFNKLFTGDPAKWVDLQNKMWADQTDLINQLNNPDADKTEVRKQIAEKELEIPVETRKQIDAFIEDCKKRGVKARTIRRQVQRKFKIVVV